MNFVKNSSRKLEHISFIIDFKRKHLEEIQGMRGTKILRERRDFWSSIPLIELIYG